VGRGACLRFETMASSATRGGHTASGEPSGDEERISSRRLEVLSRLRVRPWGLAGLAWLVLGVVVLLAYGKPWVGYDAMYALVWGREIVGGAAPEFDLPVAPTPHPLANFFGALVSPLGDGGVTAFEWLSILSFVALGWAAFRLGTELFSVPVGLVFSTILMTRPLLVLEMQQVSIDIPFLALILWAASLEANKPRRGWQVLAPLAVAGLLRPEAWVLSALYTAYAVSGRRRRKALSLVALAAAAPLIWMTFDLAVTGDPVFSLHGTRSLAEALARPRGLGTALHAAPLYLESILGKPIAWLGIAGSIVGIAALYERARLPAVLMGLGLAWFLFLGIAGLPVITRYLLIPATMLALFAGVAAFGWRHVPRPGRPRRVWAAGSAALLIGATIAIPHDLRQLDHRLAQSSERRTLQEDLLKIASSPAAREWRHRCAAVYVPTYRAVPVVAFSLHEHPRAVQSAVAQQGSKALVVAPANRIVGGTFLLDPREPQSHAFTAPIGSRLVEANRSWRLYERC
jgi:hypothetical protein